MFDSKSQGAWTSVERSGTIVLGAGDSGILVHILHFVRSF